MVRALLAGCTSTGNLGAAIAFEIFARLPEALAPTSGVTRCHARGLTWSIDLRDNLQRELLFLGEYDAPTLRVIRERLLPDDVIVDVGANIGAFSLPIARHLHRLGGRGRVISVEPGSESSALLWRHLSGNGLTQLIDVERVAFGASVGRAQLRTNSNFSGEDLGTRSVFGDGEIVEEVEVVRADESLRLRHGITAVDVVKIDVEGSEMSVLEGMSRWFEEHPPRMLLVEVIDVHLRRGGSSAGDLFQWLRSRGYRGWWVRLRGLRPVDDDALRAGNVLFLREAAV